MNPLSRLARWCGATAALVLIAVALSFLAFSQMENAATARQRSYITLGLADDFMFKLKDAEAGQRADLLSGDESQRLDYQSASDSLAGLVGALRQRAATPVSLGHLDALTPLLTARLAELSRETEQRRQPAAATPPGALDPGLGARLMASIGEEMTGFTRVEKLVLAGHDARLKSRMNLVFGVLVSASLLALLCALALAYLIHRQTLQEIRNLVQSETEHLLQVQQASNRQLRELNLTLAQSEEKLSVTLNSIGDAVIATDAAACVTRLNPVAEQLTGWTQGQAIGRPVTEIFQIINKESRQPSVIPIMDTLTHGTVQGLANHTVLIARDGGECDIADSCAPIRDRGGEVVGAVLVFRNVSREYAAQQAVRDSAALVHTILNTVVDGIVTLHARGGIIETVNPAVEQMFGYSADELRGQSFSLLIPELDQDQRHGSLAYYSASAEARASGLGRELTGQRKDGSTFALEIAVSEMQLGGKRYFTGLLRDISKRKQAEAELLKAGALQNAIFNSANFSSIATDARGVIQIFNVGAERMLGYAAVDVMNKISPADMSDPQELIARAETLSAEFGTRIAPGFEALVFKASRGIEDIYELTYRRKDGSRFPALVSVTALRDAGGAIIGYLLIGIDNTARKRIESERAVLDQALQDKNAELEQARFVAERANLAKSEFLSSMSHELRTPLSAILGFAQLIDSGATALTPPQQRGIDQIQKAGWYLLELINEILDLALIESGKLSLSMEPVALDEVLLECEAMIEPQALLRGIQLSFPRCPVPLVLWADRTRLKQVLLNLLSNAIKYNKQGGAVTVDCEADQPGSIRVRVRDTGLGLAPPQLAQLFQPFNRLGQKDKGQEGTGIGLVVCKRLVELMGGRIGVESTVGAGSTFWFNIRLSTELQDSTERPPPSLDSAALAGDASRRTLLYVEDNPANLMLVEDILARRPDVRLLTARDGKSGVELARAARPDVILMDINLPGISGIKALRMLAHDRATAHIPVVALSANAIPRDIEKGLAAGFFRYLTKPIKVHEFMATLDVALKSAEQSKTGFAPKKEETP